MELAQFELLKSSPTLVAVSGGADSVALLLALKDAMIAPLTVAHINHQLRGEDSEADAQFVVHLCEKLSIPCIVQRVTLSNGNMENEARRLRYQHFEQIAKDHNCLRVATGHTADDQAETLLHRLIRGTGIAGLRGIAACRPIQPYSPIQVVRPLLQTSRQEVEFYLAERNQAYRTDATNADLVFTRNRIRQEILPLLKTMNPKILESLNETASHATALWEMVYEQVMLALKTIEKPKAGAMVVLAKEPLLRLSDTLRAEVFRHLWARENWPTGDMTTQHWQRLAALHVADYPGRVRLTVTPMVVRLEPPS